MSGVAVAATLMATVGGFVGGTAAIAGASTTKYTIAFNVGAEADPFFQSMYLGASQEAAKLGVTLLWGGDPEDYSPTTQIPQVQQQLAENPNALIIAPTSTTDLNTIIAQAVASGIKVFNVDSGSSVQSNITNWVTGNNTQGGTAAADALASAIGYTKNCTKASPCTVAVGVSSLTTSTDAARVAGFNAEVKAKYPNIKTLSAIVSNSESAVAQKGFVQDITAHKLAGIFAVDGSDAVGATAAAQATKSKVKIVGYDAYADNIKSMQAGGIGALSAIIAQQPTLEGSTIVADAYAALTGTAVTPQLDTLANILLTPSNCKKLCSTYQYAAS